MTTVEVIRVEPLHAPTTFTDWLCEHGLTVQVKERDSDTVRRMRIPPWYASLIPHTETLEGGFATTRHGSGDTPEQAVEDLMVELCGRRMRKLRDDVGDEFYAPT